MTSCGEHKTPPGDRKISTFFSKSAKLLQVGFATVIGILQRRINPFCSIQIRPTSCLVNENSTSRHKRATSPLASSSKLRHPYMIIGNNQTIFNRFLPFLMLYSLHRTPILIMTMPVTIPPLSQFFLLSSSASSMKHFSPIHSLFITEFTLTNVPQLL